MRPLIPIALLAFASSLAAQAAMVKTSPALERAAGTITAADVGRRVHIIADDSMMGRDTPSPGLEKTAQYVADEFKRFGLKPGGENGTWFQRYEITQARFSPTMSHVGFAAGDQHVHADFTRSARYRYGTIPAGEFGGPAFVLGGALDAEALKAVELKGRVVVLVVDNSKAPSPGFNQAFRDIRLKGPAALVLLSNRDSAQVAAMMTQPYRTSLRRGGAPAGGPAVEVWERTVTAVLAAAGINTAEIRASTTPFVREVPALKVMLDLKEEVVQKTTAPNTIGILEGSDPRLKGEYIVYSAHMDHVGISPGKPDSINNGADDDASGTVAVVELAEAFSQQGARPKRSILFITVSGEEKGLWGSEYFADHPTVPLPSIVANINIDMIGRNWADTIVAIGREHSDLGQTLARVNTAHPELNMTAIDDKWPEERFYFRSDHYNFAKKGIPILFFFNGVHEDYHKPSDSPDKIGTDKHARITQLLFYLGQEIANSPERPKWNPESYQKIVVGGGE